MIYALGGVSGAHFNPAATVALTLAGKSPAGDIPHYMAAQLLGGLAASLACAAIHSKRLRMTRSQAKLMCSRAFRVKREATGT